MQVSYLIKK